MKTNLSNIVRAGSACPLFRADIIRLLLTALLALALTLTLGCEEKSEDKAAEAAAAIARAKADAEQAPEPANAEQTPKPSETKLLKYIPKGHRFDEEVRGDLNGDGAEDYLLAIKSETASDSLGIVILFKDGSDYRLALEKLRCFYTEFHGPSFEINKGNFIISFNGNGTCDQHEWSYTFKYRNSEFELIGYDAIDVECGGWNEKHEREGGSYFKESINFLTKKRLTKVAYKGKETWDKITTKGPILLREINMETFNIKNYMEVSQ